MRPKPSIPEIFFGLFVMMRMVVRPEVGQDLAADAVVALVGGEAELEVRLDGVEPLPPAARRPELVEQADAAAFLRQVEQHAARLLLDPLQRGVELVAAVAAEPWKTSPVRHSL